VPPPARWIGRLRRVADPARHASAAALNDGLTVKELVIHWMIRVPLAHEAEISASLAAKFRHSARM